MTMHSTTLIGNKAIREEQLATFRQSLNGTLLCPGDATYDQVRRIWNGMFDRRPALIARCQGTADVIDAVNFAREHDLLVSIRGGGHNVAGYAVCDGGMMIDLSRMKGVWVDPGRYRVRVQGGALWSDVDRECQLHGLATPGGVVSHTGVAGLTLGGGFGWLSRKHGLTCDNLLSAEIVTADGKLITVSAEEHADLFWAIRGGGGNFGVVTAFELQLHPAGPTVVAGLVFYPFAQAKRVLQQFRDFAATASEDLYCVPLLRLAPTLPFLPEAVHGQAVVGIAACHFGTIAEGQAAAEILSTFGEPLVSLFAPKPYLVHQKFLDVGAPHGRCYYWKSEYLPDLNDAIIDTAIEHAAHISSAHSLIAFFQHDGAINRIDPTATAYGQRSAAFALNISSAWDDIAESDRHIAWTRRFWSAMQPHSTGGGYINFLSEDDDPNRVKAAVGGVNYERLCAIKAKYDPTNFFRMNQNIKPMPQ